MATKKIRFIIGFWVSEFRLRMCVSVLPPKPIPPSWGLMNNNSCQTLMHTAYDLGFPASWYRFFRLCSIYNTYKVSPLIKREAVFFLHEEILEMGGGGKTHCCRLGCRLPMRYTHTLKFFRYFSTRPWTKRQSCNQFVRLNTGMASLTQDDQADTADNKNFPNYENDEGKS
jgi:hypothetical protein